MKNYFALWHSISNICSTKFSIRAVMLYNMSGLFLCPSHNKKVVQYPHCMVVMAIQALIEDLVVGKVAPLFLL